MKKPLQYGMQGICSPCMHCEKRSIECHTNCSKYKEWSAEREGRRKKQVETMPFSAEKYRRECRAKAAKKWSRRRRKNHVYFKIGRK